VTVDEDDLLDAVARDLVDRLLQQVEAEPLAVGEGAGLVPAS